MSESRYDVIANDYAERPDDYSVPATAAVFDLLGSVTSERVIDLACGHGMMARRLAREGAHVVAVDISAELIAVARTREAEERLGIEYIRQDVTDSSLLRLGDFDAVICNFGLSDIDDFDAVISNVAGVLRRLGRFVFSILHPCFPGFDLVSGSWPSEQTYYDEGWWLPNGELSTIRNKVGANHRMVSTYINSIIGAGLVIDRVCEPPPLAEAGLRSHLQTLPMFLTLRAVKPRVI